MTIRELVKELNEIEDHNLPVFVQDGMDPSDFQEAHWINIKEAGKVYPYDLPKLVTIS